MKPQEKLFQIDKDVPIPTYHPGRSGHGYPFAKMEIGDSFFTDKKTVRGSAYSYGKRNSKKFSVNAEAHGFRVWRIE